MSRPLLLALVLATASCAAAAQSQKVYRCVDERGRVYYTEKAGRNCKPTSINSLPGGAQIEKAPAARAPTPSKPLPQSVVVRPIGQCASLKAGVAQLENAPPRGDPKARQQRLAGLRQALQRDCGS